MAATPSLVETADIRRDIPMRNDSFDMVDRAEQGIQFISRWAGILAFAGALAGIVYLIF